MKHLRILLLLFYSVNCFSQHLLVNSGIFSMGNNTTLNLYQTSLVVNGTIRSYDTNTVIINDLDNNTTISGASTVRLNTLLIKSNCTLSTNMDLSGDLELYNGKLDIGASSILLGGNIVGESEQYHIFSAANGQISRLVNLTAGQTVNPGNLGMEITPGADYANVTIIRGHAVQLNDMSTSISRYYAIPSLNEAATLRIRYFESELNGLQEDQLKLWVENNGLWSVVENSEINLSDNSCYSSIGQGVTQISLFEFYSDSKVSIPNGFSPNNDGENDFFIISGVENFPQNKLSVFNQWGDIVFEAEPYENNWGGENKSGKGSAKNQILGDGTYFYIFFEDKNKEASVQKGFIELKSRDKL
jgi:gliding motility-associated-like protein